MAQLSYEQKEASKKVRKATYGLAFVAAVASIGCVFVKNKNGMSIAENIIRRVNAAEIDNPELFADMEENKTPADIRQDKIGGVLFLLLISESLVGAVGAIAERWAVNKAKNSGVAQSR